MMQGLGRVILLGILLAQFVGFGLVASAVQTEGASAPAWQPWRGQLEALRPSAPMEYIELGEALADAAHAADSRSAEELRTLARQLFGLAGAIDPARFGRSACLALAEIARDKQERERLLALANLLPTRDVLATWSASVHEEPVRPSEALAISEALGYYRNGLGNRALAALQRADSASTLERFGHLLPGGPERFFEDCKHYVNGRKPTLFEGQIAKMLILESALLANTERSWAGEIMLTSAKPMIEIDPDQLDEMLRVDASRPYFVNGNFERLPAKR